MDKFSYMNEDNGEGCEVHEFPNSCAVQVLAEFGFAAAEISALRDKGIV